MPTRTNVWLADQASCLRAGGHGIASLLDSMQNARLVCIKHLPAITHSYGAVAQLGERMTGNPRPTVLLINNN